MLNQMKLCFLDQKTVIYCVNELEVCRQPFKSQMETLVKAGNDQYVDCGHQFQEEEEKNNNPFLSVPQFSFSADGCWGSLLADFLQR